MRRHPTSAAARVRSEALLPSRPSQHDLVTFLAESAAAHPDRPAFASTDGLVEQEHLTAGDLWSRAGRIAAAIAEQVPAGDRALLVYPPGLGFVEAFYGCLAADVIAVPSAPPDPSRLARTMPRLEAILADARPSLLLTTSELIGLRTLLSASGSPLAKLPWLATDEVASRPRTTPQPRALGRVNENTVAHLQYTSGSTATPRGVIVTHGNLLANVEVMRVVHAPRPGDIVVGWAPLFHDMGLVVHTVMPLCLELTSILMSPADFLRDPVRWLRVMTHYSAQVSGGPNFAYELCARRVTEEDLDALDLSSWNDAFVSAEPVNAGTLDRFTARFRRAGFSTSAFAPCYGLAETTLVVASGGPRRPIVLPMDSTALERGVALPNPAGRSLVANGPVAPAHRIRIVDPVHRAAVGNGQIGEVWVCGPSVAAGYHARPEDTESTFHAFLADGDGPYCRTGDLGFLHNGELFITGRAKDLIIVRGRNLYPQDIELVVERAHRSVRPGCVIAFAETFDDLEGVVVAAELRVETEEEQLTEIATTLAAASAADADVKLTRIVFLPPGQLPKTSSGKVQRRRCRAALQAGELRTLAVFDGPALVDAAVRARIARIATGDEIIGQDTTLAEIGMDSLQAVELALELEQSLGLGIAMSAPTPRTTIGELLDAVTLAPGGPRADHSPRPADDPSAISTIQAEILHDHQRCPGSHATAIGLSVTGRSPADAVRAVQRLARRHTLLRSTFRGSGDLVRRTVHPTPIHSLRTIDGRGLSEDARQLERGADVLRPFRLDLEPPLRCTVLRTDETELEIVLTLQHLAYDAQTLVRVASELVAELDEGSVAEPTIDYAAVAAGDRRSSAPADLVQARSRVAGIPTTLRADEQILMAGEPMDGPPPRRLDGRIAAQIRSTARSHRTTPFAIAFHAALTGIATLTESAELLVGTAVDRRDTSPLAGAFGPVFGYVPIHVRLDELSIDDVRDRLDSGLSCRDLPLSSLVDGAGLGLPVNINYYELGRVSPRVAALRAGASVPIRDGLVREVELGHLPTIRPYELVIGFHATDDTLAFSLRHAAGLFSPAEVTSAADAIEQTLLTTTGAQP